MATSNPTNQQKKIVKFPFIYLFTVLACCLFLPACTVHKKLNENGYGVFWKKQKSVQKTAEFEKENTALTQVEHPSSITIKNKDSVITQFFALDESMPQGDEPKFSKILKRLKPKSFIAVQANTSFRKQPRIGYINSQNSSVLSNKSSGKGLSIASLILGILSYLALVISFVTEEIIILLILSFLLSVLGLVFGSIALKKNRENKALKIFSIVGMSFSSLTLIFNLGILLLLILIGF